MKVSIKNCRRKELLEESKKLKEQIDRIFKEQANKAKKFSTSLLEEI